MLIDCLLFKRIDFGGFKCILCALNLLLFCHRCPPISLYNHVDSLLITTINQRGTLVLLLDLSNSTKISNLNLSKMHFLVNHLKCITLIEFSKANQWWIKKSTCSFLAHELISMKVENWIDRKAIKTDGVTPNIIMLAKETT